LRATSAGSSWRLNGTPAGTALMVADGPVWSCAASVASSVLYLKQS
jgi:hypothetical protein